MGYYWEYCGTCDKKTPRQSSPCECEGKNYSQLKQELEAVKTENIQLKSRLTVLQIELAHKNAGDSKLNFNS